MNRKDKVLQRVRVQTISILLIFCTLSALCYANMLRKNTLGNSIEECQSAFQESQGVFQKIDVITQWIDDCWYQSIIKKAVLGKVDAEYTYVMAKEIASSQVLKGTEEWLFYKSIDDGDTIADFEGTNLYSDKQIQDISDGVLKVQNELKNKGIEFQVLICPNKEIIYHEYMPDLYTRAEITKGGLLCEELTKRGIVVNYPQSLLEANKNYQLYYFYDTHWNQLGAYVATCEVLSRWGIEVEQLIKRDIISRPLKECHHLSALEDLANMADLLPILEKEKADSEFIVEGTSEIDWKRFEMEEDKGELSHFYNLNAKEKKTILLIGDSFRVSMVPLLSEVFENVYVVHENQCEKNILEQISPDYVIVEYVERYVDDIIDIDEMLLEE